MSCVGSMEVFLSTGVTRACLCVAGNREVDSEALTSLVSISENTGRDLTSCVGIESALLVRTASHSATDVLYTDWLE